MVSVAVFTPSFPRFEGDYHGVFIKELCDRLSKHVKLEVIAPRSRTMKKYQINYRVYRYGYMPSQRMEYIAEATMKNPSGLIKACLPAYIVSAYMQILRTQAKLIHTHLAIPFGFMCAYNPRKTPQLVTCHGSDISYPFDHPVYQGFTRKALEKADHVAAVSEYIKGLAIKLGSAPEKTSTIYLGVDTDRFNPGRKDGTLTVGTLGRLVREKNIDEIIFAARRLRERYDFRLIIGGDGPDLFRLKRLSDKLGVQAEFVGRVDDPVVFHKSLDVFVLASRREGLSVSLMEAMASEAVPVAVDGYANTELITDGVNGFLYRGGDIDSLVSCMGYAIENQNCGVNARNTIRKGFSKDQATRKYLTLYHELGIS